MAIGPENQSNLRKEAALSRSPFTGCILDTQAQKSNLERWISRFSDEFSKLHPEIKSKFGEDYVKQVTAPSMVILDEGGIFNPVLNNGLKLGATTLLIFMGHELGEDDSNLMLPDIVETFLSQRLIDPLLLINETRKQSATELIGCVLRVGYSSISDLAPKKIEKKNIFEDYINGLNTDF